jgi:hypothetical protein
LFSFNDANWLVAFVLLDLKSRGSRGDWWCFGMKLKDDSGEEVGGGLVGGGLGGLVGEGGGGVGGVGWVEWGSVDAGVEDAGVVRIRVG